MDSALQSRWQIFKSAFLASLPIMLGYVLMGVAFGIMLDEKGYGALCAFFMAMFIYAGVMQFAAVELLAQGLDFIALVVLAFVINARHIFYGISMLGAFSKYKGLKKIYMIFTLTDETFALLNLKKPLQTSESNQPNNTKYGREQSSTETSGIYSRERILIDEVESQNALYCFFIALLNQIYWVIGCVGGSLSATLLHKNGISTQGVEFVMSAVFLVIFLEQFKTHKWLGVIGIVIGVLSLWIFGADSFLLPAIFIGIALVLIYKNLELKALYNAKRK
ncbi:AzlC family ABC transporter permease [Helicobacter himalayensis]|uniref:AzlC family ABC transporter permease n=1 Tax=Helicobacter himalayensis TaxID=1591088 RepID=UPI003D6EB195